MPFLQVSQVTPRFVSPFVPVRLALPPEYLDLRKETSTWWGNVLQGGQEDRHGSVVHGRCALSALPGSCMDAARCRPCPTAGRRGTSHALREALRCAGQRQQLALRVRRAAAAARPARAQVKCCRARGDTKRRAAWTLHLSALTGCDDAARLMVCAKPSVRLALHDVVGQRARPARKCCRAAPVEKEKRLLARVERAGSPPGAEGEGEKKKRGDGDAAASARRRPGGRPAVAAQTHPPAGDRRAPTESQTLAARSQARHVGRAQSHTAQPNQTQTSSPATWYTSQASSWATRRNATRSSFFRCGGRFALPSRSAPDACPCLVLLWCRVVACSRGRAWSRGRPRCSAAMPGRVGAGYRAVRRPVEAYSSRRVPAGRARPSPPRRRARSRAWSGLVCPVLPCLSCPARVRVRVEAGLLSGCSWTRALRARGALAHRPSWPAWWGRARRRPSRSAASGRRPQSTP
jgi:hypothetical protein